MVWNYVVVTITGIAKVVREEDGRITIHGVGNCGSRCSYRQGFIMCRLVLKSPGRKTTRYGDQARLIFRISILKKIMEGADSDLEFGKDWVENVWIDMEKYE